MSTLLIKKGSHKRYATLTSLAVSWALWSFKIFLWSELYWWAFKEWISCCLQIDRILRSLTWLSWALSWSRRVAASDIYIPHLNWIRWKPLQFKSNWQKRLLFYTQVWSSCLGVSCKKGVFQNFAKFAGKHLCQSLFFNRVAVLVFSYEFCEIFKNTFFYRTPPVAASVRYDLLLIKLNVS